ncbi:MAG: SDR family oxidoreductase [Acidobacteriota bacterium]|nr:SDR family oxidoreductase [Acidobacteriota bacterium]
MTEVLLITGGARGIGAATARLAAARGYAVCVNYLRDKTAADTLVAEIEAAGGRALALQGDVASETGVERLYKVLDGELGPVTALVNNAGLTGLISRLDEAEGGTLRRVIEVNVLGTFYCARAAVRRMSTRHGGSGGAIVNLSSGAATLGSPGEYVWYAASKGAVDSFTLGLAKEVAGEGIRVNAVAPGMVATEIHAASGDAGRLERIGGSVPIGRHAEPEEIAEAALWLLSPAASYVTGTILRAAGGR